MEVKHKKININYLLLCQGQFVSNLGNVIFDLALGIWILKITGSKSLMATLMSISFIPKIFLGPFAGVICDLYDRKKIIILSDLINGLFMIIVSILAILNISQIWMFFAISIILGINSCFFNPSINSLLPTIVEKESIVKCNSFLNVTRVSTEILGSSLGGFLLNIVSAPVLFLFNGISFFISAITEIFIKLPIPNKRKIQKVNFIQNLKEGFIYTWNFKGLKSLIFIATLLNFFTTMAMTALIPYFICSKNLGSAKYGFSLSLMTIGMFLGMIIMSIVNVSTKKKFNIFSFSGILFPLFFIIAINSRNYSILLICFTLAGFFHATMHAFIGSSLQISIDSDKRGKVFAIYSTCCNLLKPLGTILTGYLCETFNEQSIISVSFLVILTIFSISFFNRHLKSFINN